MPHADDYPRSMRDPDVRERRRSMLNELHVAPLVEYANELASMGRGEVPMPDPLGGGINAQVFFLFEKPGPQANSSGFLSINNNDPTAETTTRWLEEGDQPQQSLQSKCMTCADQAGRRNDPPRAAKRRAATAAGRAALVPHHIVYAVEARF